MKQNTPMSISVKQFLEYRNNPVKPIDGLIIPNITYPPHLTVRKRATEAVDTIAINIRHCFNSLTSDNIDTINKQLRDTVNKAQNMQDISSIAQEMLSNFIINEVNIKNYMLMLNNISAVCILMPAESPSDEPIKSKTIGNIFLAKCRELIFKYISEDHIRMLSMLDQDDIDDLDKYNREREKIINLIITICFLYEQRSSSHIKLTGAQLIPLMTKIISSYKNIQSKMKELGDPYEDECLDEEEYEICDRMCSIYAEQLYEFINREIREFNHDPFTSNTNETFKSLIQIFKDEIVPSLNQAFLISKCKDINYD